MKYTWWIVRGLVGAAIGFVIGGMGCDIGFAEMGGVLGFAFGLGFPDREQRVMSCNHLNPAPVDDDAPKTEVWPPAPRVVKGHW